MTHLERQIRTAQRIIWCNRWQRALAWSLTVAGLAYAVCVLLQRLFAWSIPLLYLGLAMAGAAVLASLIWAAVNRVDKATAAAILDQNAGLRERISSGLYCQSDSDPFARAVVSDAERAGASVTVRRHVRVEFPRPFALTAGSFLLAAAMFLLTPGLLRSNEALEAAVQSSEAEQARVAVKRELEDVRKLAEENPVLADLTPDWKAVDSDPGAELSRPESIRHEAIKRIDRLEDTVKRKRSNSQYDAVPEMQRMLRGLRVPKSADAPTEKLAKAMAKGEFKEAREEIAKLQEQLATLKSEEDEEFARQLSEQLDDLAQQLEKLASDEKLAEKLEQAGLEKKDVDRMLERLSKADLDQLQKKLQEKGWSQEKIQKLARQLQQKQQARGMAQKMSQGMKQAAQGAESGQMGQAAAGLRASGEQLGQLEQLEQEMNQLDAAMAELGSARSNLDNPCSQCNGTGAKGGRPCGSCRGRGRGGMGGLGRGRGGLAGTEKTDVDFKTERTKVPVGRGATIGEFLIEGEQVKGEASSSLAEVVTAAEREASDLIHRDRVPRQYHKAIKEYFSNLRESAELPPTSGTPVPEPATRPTSPAEDSDGE